MKLVSSLFAVAVLCCVCSFYSCTKTFKDGTGLYSVKQYHRQAVTPGGDTVLLGDVHIGISEADNNYIVWNGITMHISYTSDSLVTYIHDTLTTAYTIDYTLNYLKKTDHVDAVGNNMIWHSF